MENLGQFHAGAGLHIQPVLKVMTKVITEERSHGERVMHDNFSLEQSNMDINFRDDNLKCSP